MKGLWEEDCNGTQNLAGYWVRHEEAYKQILTQGSLEICRQDC